MIESIKVKDFDGTGHVTIERYEHPENVMVFTRDGFGTTTLAIVNGRELLADLTLLLGEG